MIRARSASRQSVRRHGTIGVRPTIAACQTVAAFQRCSVRASMPARAQAGASRASVGAGLRDVTHQGLAVFQAGHSSSPSWKTAESFFDSTSKAAVSASALSLRCSSRSSSLTRRRSCSGFRGAGRTRFAETGDRVLLPGRPARPDTAPARGTRRFASPHPSPLWRSPPAAAPPAVQRWAARRQIHWPRHLARQRSSVATLIPTSARHRSTDELSGGNSRATIRSLYACPYRATSCFRAPKGSDPIRATTSLTQGAAPGRQNGSELLACSSSDMQVWSSKRPWRQLCI